MRSSRALVRSGAHRPTRFLRAAGLIAGLVAGATATSRAEAQQVGPSQPPGPTAAEGFAVERLSLSAPGAGWFAMDSLDMHGGFGGAVSMTAGYERDPLRIANPSGGKLGVVTDRAFADFGMAATFDRWRLSLNLDMPIVSQGQTGVVGNQLFTGPSLTVGSNPDVLSDARFGLDVRVLGRAEDPVRFGLGAQLFVPNGDRADYITDHSYRAVFRALFAGDYGYVTWAAHLGIHVRPLDDSSVAQSPQGDEALFGIAAGLKVPVLAGTEAVAVGPEVFGATAFRSLFGGRTTALEAMLTGRLEGVGERGPQLRFKVGAGGGVHDDFGAPEWRLVFAIELFGHESL